MNAIIIIIFLKYNRIQMTENFILFLFDEMICEKTD
jgi:hypothetical protein